MAKHWRNLTEPGDIVIATTSTLDFAPIFHRFELAEEMSKLIFETKEFLGAKLHAFVVMPEHIHLFLTLPPHIDGSSYMRRLKSYSATRLRSLLLPREESLFVQQTGLNRRVFWQRSFRARSIMSGWRFTVAIRYIHRNPVKRGLCERPEDWRWSSAWMHAHGLHDPELGLGLKSFVGPDL